MTQPAFQSQVTHPVVIAINESLTAGIALDGLAGIRGMRLFGVSFPAAWSTANLTFQTSVDGGTTYQDMGDDNGTEVTLVAAAAKNRYLRDPQLFSSVTHLKVRSGTSAVPVTQAAARTLKLILRSI